MKKKSIFISTILALTLAIGITGCSAKSDNADTQDCI